MGTKLTSDEGNHLDSGGDGGKSLNQFLLSFVFFKFVHCLYGFTLT